jgi:hypothetical protein
MRSDSRPHASITVMRTARADGIVACTVISCRAGFGYTCSPDVASDSPGTLDVTVTASGDDVLAHPSSFVITTLYVPDAVAISSRLVAPLIGVPLKLHW